MPRRLKPGENIRGYEIQAILSEGAMAVSYKARNRRGELAFFKQYNSPTVLVKWYPAYVAYQQAMKNRIEASPFKNFTYGLIEFFEEDARPRCYFQVFEFVTEGRSLADQLANDESLTWEQRLTMAQVMMGAVAQMHETKIVHADLKPANIILIPVEARVGYRLKLIDMDFSLLADRQAPWHGHEGAGYFGTPGYMSPEHMRAGEIPSTASDVFTCGLILYELLCDCPAYMFEDQDQYRTLVLGHRAKPPKLLGSMPDGNDAEVVKLIHQCLVPLPASRPNAKQVHHELCRRPTGPAKSRPATRPAGAPKPSIPATPVATPTPVPSPAALRLWLRSESGQKLSFGVTTVISRRLCKPLGDDAKYWDDPQFTLEKQETGWRIIPAITTNQTLLNGKQIAESQSLKEGDVVAVGNEKKGLVKLPLTVHFRSE